MQTQAIIPVFSIFHLLKNVFIDIFERKEVRGKEKEKHYRWERNTDPLPPAHPLMGVEPETRASALTRNQTGNLLVHGVNTKPLRTPAGL